MNPPRVTDGDKVDLTWDTVPTFSPLSNPKTCPGNCHDSKPSTSKASGFFFQNPSAQPQPTRLVGAERFLSSPPQTWFPAQAGNVSPPPVQDDPAKKDFKTQAQASEKLSAETRYPAKKLEYLQTALFNYQMAQDPEAKRILGLIREEYKKSGNEAGLTKVDAELAFCDGKFADALKGFKTLEMMLNNPKLPLDAASRYQGLTELNLKISLTLQAMASEASRNKDLRKASTYMEEAMQRTPSKELTEKTVKLFIQSGEGNLPQRRKEIDALKKRIALKKYDGCNVNCHSARKNDDSISALGGSIPQYPPGYLKDVLAGKSPMLKQGDVTPPGNVHAYPSPTQPNSFEARQAARKKEVEAMEWELVGLEADYEKTRDHLEAIVRTGMGKPNSREEKVRIEMAVGEALSQAGDLDRAAEVYKKTLDGLKQPETGAQDPQITLQRVGILHELAYLHREKGNQFLLTTRLASGDHTRALDFLAQAEKEINEIDPSTAKHTDDGKNPLLTAKETLLIQNQFLKAEVLLNSSKDEESVKQAQEILENLVYKPPVDLWNHDAGDPQDKLLAQAKLRLAQTYFGHPEESSAFKGNRLVEQLLHDFPKDSELCSQALLAQGMARLRMKGKSLEGLSILRGIQTKYPESGADKIIRESTLLKSVVDSNGIIKTNLSESDYGEALKVALDRAVNTSAGRKMGFMAIGAIIVLLLIPEPSSKVVAIGLAAGLATDMAIGVAENWGDVKDAFATGLSNVDGAQNAKNIFMLGIDLAMLVTAGFGGRIVRGGLEAGASYFARGASPYIASLGLSQAEKGVLFAMGRGFLRVALPVAEDLSAYTIYKGERSLFLGENFQWDPKEALLMMGMCRSFALAQSLNVGARLSTLGKFQKGASYDVLAMTEKGPVKIGQTNAAGKVAGWATDGVIGATGYYGMLLGIDKTSGGVPSGVPNYADFLGQNLFTMGGLHLGGKFASKVTGLDGSLEKLGKKSEGWMKEAREIIENGPPPGGIGPFGMQWAYATVPVGSGGIPEKSSPNRLPWKSPTILMSQMQSLGPLEYDLLEHDIVTENDHAINPEDTSVEITANKAEDSATIIQSIDKHLPAEVKRVVLVLPEKPDAETLLKLEKLALAKGITCEVFTGPKNATPLAKITKDGIALTDTQAVADLLSEGIKQKLNLKLTDPRGETIARLQDNTVEIKKSLGDKDARLSTYQKLAAQALQSGRSLEILDRGSQVLKIISAGKSFTLEIPEGGKLIWNAPTNGSLSNRAQLQFNPVGSKDAMQILARIASEVPVERFSNAKIEVKGFDLTQVNGLKSSLSPFIRKALFGGSESVSIGEQWEVRNNSGLGKTKYSVTTPMEFSLVNTLQVEFLSFETARSLGIKDCNDPRLAKIQELWRGAMREVDAQAKNTDAAKAPAEKHEHEKYLYGKDWTKQWQSTLEAMIDFNAQGEQAKSFESALEKIQKFSQKDEGSFLGFESFNGRAFDDNAYELVRLFQKSSKDPSLKVATVLKDINGLLGSSGNVELYGAVVGIVVKASTPGMDPYTGTSTSKDNGAINELDRYQEMIRETKNNSSGKYRLTVVPEDRMKGSTYGTKDFTKTPEWILEMLGPDGSTQRTLSVEVKNKDAGRSLTEYTMREKGADGKEREVKTTDLGKTIKDAAYQLLEHQFNSAQGDKDALLIVKLYSSKGQEAKIAQEVQRAMKSEYERRMEFQKRYADQKGKADRMKKLRVKVILEDGSYPKGAKTLWFEYGNNGEWMQRSVNNANENNGTNWLENSMTAVGW